MKQYFEHSLAFDMHVVLIHISKTTRRPKGQILSCTWVQYGSHFCLLISPKKHNFVEDVEILLFIKYRCRREVANASANQRPGMPSCFSKQPEKTNLVKDAEILLPVKIRWIPFRGFREEVENVLANQRPGGHLVFYQSKKHKLGRGRWYLASCQVSFNSVQRFQKRRRKSHSQSEVGVAILFSDRPEKHKFGKGRWNLAFCHVSLNSVQRFQRRSGKCLVQTEAWATILFFRSARNTNL